MNKQLAYFSIALGAVEVVAPNLLSRAIGLEPKAGLMRALGLREIGTGLGMLYLPRSPAGPGARVAGDAMDLAVLGLTSRLGGTRSRRLGALLAVVGVMAIDIYATRKAAARRRAVHRYKLQNRVPTHIPTLAAASPH